MVIVQYEWEMLEEWVKLIFVNQTVREQIDYMCWRRNLRVQTNSTSLQKDEYIVMIRSLRDERKGTHQLISTRL